MAFILHNARVFTGGVDLTSVTNKVELSSEVEEKDVTNFGSGGWKEHLGGLASTSIETEGHWEAGDSSTVDPESWAALGGVGAWSVGPDTPSLSSVAWITRALRGKYTLGGTVGDVAPWTASATGTWPLVRGRVAHLPGVARTTTGSGNGIELGAVSSAQQLYAAVHVLSVAGTASPSITVTVESDVDNSFASPVTRLMFDPATTRGGQIMRTTGPITDTWYRVSWTITGTTPSFLFLACLGIH